MDTQSRPRPTKRWLILVGLFAVGYFDIGTLKSLGVFLEKMTEDLQTSLAVVGLAIGLCHGVAQCFGFGYSVVLLPSQVSVLDYFPDHFEIATTIVILGSGVGMMTLPLLTEQLVVAYSWRGAILILGALNLHMCVTGLLMVSAGQQRRVLGEPSTLAIRSQVRENHEETVSLINEHVSVYPHNIDDNGDDDDDDDDDDRNGHGVFYSIARIARAAKKVFLDTFDFKIFRECPRFITICMTLFTYAVSYYGWIVFLIPNAEAKGISPEKAVLLATIGGAGNIFGRLTIGLQAARFNLKPQITYCLICIVSAVAFFYNFFTKSFSILSCLAAINGFALGGKVMSSNLLCKDTVSDERFPAALSFVSLVFGIGETVGALLIGLLYDITKSFDIMFCVLGAANILESCIIISPIIKDWMVALVTTR
ncbi:monocarboxylate transporter 12-like [Strongylocentrotus purpuratus]|uniref:Uncharacterized protein n=1 Tax=Strongylocentrotus purpuratus TaxID=7668 RepID=A0A7M7REY3_STRPU|nr:monocarboxylate transporter 12-like [Strongylocentrotus purpuratus]|eukprot:XP_796149.1 PREDICTED: monocarboxylate transporter 12-like [Strongylocentrotus purpuratus]